LPSDIVGVNHLNKNVNNPLLALVLEGKINHIQKKKGKMGFSPSMSILHTAVHEILHFLSHRT